MKILVLSQRYSRDSLRIEEAALQAGYHVIRVSSDNTSQWAQAEHLVVYCEGFMAEYVSQHSQMVLLRPLDHALTVAPIAFLQRSVRHIQARDLPTLSLPTFIKPADQKFFGAGVYERLDSLSEVIQETPEASVLVSEVVNFVDEYRFFCLNGEVLTASAYRLAGAYVGEQEDLPPVPVEALYLAEAACHACVSVIPPACVVDVGRLDNGEYALIEFNPAWTSGIYGADPSLALQCIAESCCYRPEMPTSLLPFETFDCEHP